MKHQGKATAMDIQVLSLILNALQTLIITISLGLLVYQLKQFNRNLQQDAYTKLAEYSMKIAELLLQDKELANEFYQRNRDYLKLNNAKKALYDYMGLIFGLYERLYLLFKMKGINQKTWRAWDKWLVDVIFPLDLFGIFWMNEGTSYHEDFCEYVRKKYKIYKTSKRT
jgi:hypothetical protein